MAHYSIGDIRTRIAKFPRVELIHRPTPLRKLERLTEELGGPEIYIKRDDLTGLAFGGNKSRKLEFIIKDALDKGCDTIITWGSLQSNWCLQTAAAATKHGLKTILVLFRSYDIPPGFDGNMLLERILGVEMRIREPLARGKVVKLEDTMALMNEIAEEQQTRRAEALCRFRRRVHDRGRHGQAVGRGQLCRGLCRDVRTDAGTRVRPGRRRPRDGLGRDASRPLVGARALADSCRVVGISVSDDAESFAGYVEAIAGPLEREMGLESVAGRGDIIVFDDYMKDGYGIVNKEVADILRRIFVSEGVVLDPVYTSKAMIGLVDLVQKGYFKAGEKVVFFHTGGTAALFPNRDKLIELLEP